MSPVFWRPDLDAMVLRDRNHPSIVIWGIGNEIPEAWTKQGPPLARQMAARVRSLDHSRPVTQAVPGATFTPNVDAVLAALDIVGEFVWTAMDYLGESGIGAWKFGTPEEVAQASRYWQGLSTAMSQMGANGENPFAGVAQQSESGGGDVSPAMALLFGGYPWHASNCGDLDLTGWRKPQSYYRDLLWNGGDRVYAAVRLPDPEGKKVSWWWYAHQERRDPSISLPALRA